MTAANGPGGRPARGLPALSTRRLALTRRWLPVGLLTGICAGAAIVSGCAAAASAEFQPTWDSKEAVAAAVLDALWQRDADRLQAMAVSETEFRKYVWPALPGARAGVGGSVDYWWTDQRTRSLGSLAQVLEHHGGQPFALVAVTFEGRSTDYGSFRLHREAMLAIRDPAGKSHNLRLFGSMIESTHGWKIYSYIID
jgi:hypothetical protein